MLNDKMINDGKISNIIHVCTCTCAVSISKPLENDLLIFNHCILYVPCTVYIYICDCL